MDAINITEFRKHLPAYLKRVRSGEELRVTSRGQVIARIVPEEDRAEAARKRLFALRGKGIVGDVESPIDVEWTADDDNL
jgi:prevent-host-death family protein